jgi:hypothetical protein
MKKNVSLPFKSPARDDISIAIGFNPWIIEKCKKNLSLTRLPDEQSWCFSVPEVLNLSN